MKKFLSILLCLVTVFSLAACNKGGNASTGGEAGDSSTVGGKEEQVEYSVKVTYGGMPFTETVGLQVQWTNGYEYFKASVEGNEAKITLPGDDYSVSLIGLDSKYTYNPGELVDKATTYTPSVEVPVYRLTKARGGSGNGEYDCKTCRTVGVYRSEIIGHGKKIFYEFEPDENGVYTVESWVDVSASLVNPKLYVYYGSSVYKTYGYTLDEGGVSKGFTRNFKYTINVDQSNVGGVWTFAIGGDHRDGDKHDYMEDPVIVDFAIMRNGGFVADKTLAPWALPEGLYSMMATELKGIQGLSESEFLEKTSSFMLSTATYGSFSKDELKKQFKQEYKMFASMPDSCFEGALAVNNSLENTLRGVETEYDEAGKPIKETVDNDCWLREYAVLKVQTRFNTYIAGGALVGAESDYYPEGHTTPILAFRGENYKLSPKTGVYHKYDAQAYASDPYGYGVGFGPVLFGKITSATRFIPSPLTMIEYAGNKALTIENGTKNYKLFVEGYQAMRDMANTPIDASGQLLGMPIDFPAECNGMLGYADFANADGVVPVTPELKDFFQKFSVSQRLFNDGNGFAEAHADPKVDALEEDQWLFACCYYTGA